MSYIELLDKMWIYYISGNPQNLKIHNLLIKEGEEVINDHIALRTINTKEFGIEHLASFFTQNGYTEQDEYDFTQKKLRAKYYLHEDPQAPKIFISELRLECFSDFLQNTLTTSFAEVDKKLMDNEDLLISGRSWNDISYANYKKLYEESEYAAWLYCFGLCPNHFTVNVNCLEKYNDLNKLNEFLTASGYKLNSQGGIIKGSVSDLLEQSSTMAGKALVEFTDGEYEIPYCYYEFAKRYKDANGKLYQGFVPQSADKIFESTDNK